RDVVPQSPAIIGRAVFLPQPDGPRNDTNSPRATSRLKSWTAAAPPPGNCFWTWVRVRNAICSADLLASAGDGHAGPPPTADEGDQDHRHQGQSEADDRDGGRFVGRVLAEQLQVRAEGGPCQER